MTLSDLSLSLENFDIANPVRNRPTMHCKSLGIEYLMYVYGLCLFDFATKNLHLATIFYHLVDKCDLRILLISSPVKWPKLLQVYNVLLYLWCELATSFPIHTTLRPSLYLPH